MYRYTGQHECIYLQYKDAAGGTLVAKPGGVYEIVATQPGLRMPPAGFEAVPAAEEEHAVERMAPAAEEEHAVEQEEPDHDGE